MELGLLISKFCYNRVLAVFERGELSITRSQSYALREVRRWWDFQWGSLIHLSLVQFTKPLLYASLSVTLDHSL